MTASRPRGGVRAIQVVSGTVWATKACAGTRGRRRRCGLLLLCAGLPSACLSCRTLPRRDSHATAEVSQSQNRLSWGLIFIIRKGSNAFLLWR